MRKLALVTIVAFLLVGSTAIAQRGRPQFSGGGSTFFLLQNEQIAEELDLVEDQKTKLRDLGQKMRDSAREMFSGLSAEERREKYSEFREKMRTELETGLNDILLPQQRDRLNQIRFQMSSRGTSGLTSDRAVEQLGLSDDQVKKLQERAEKLRTELREKLQQLEKEAREELLEVLTPEQRKKYEDLVGEPFELQGGFGQGFRGRGEGRDGGRFRRPDGNQSDRPQT